MAIELKQRSPLGAFYRTPLDVLGPGVPAGLALEVEMRTQDQGTYLTPSQDPCFIGFPETGTANDRILQYVLTVKTGGDRTPTHQEFRDEFAARSWVGVRTLTPLNMGGTFYCEGPRLVDVNQVYNPGVQSTRSQFSTGPNYPLGSPNYVDYREGTGPLGYENGEFFYDAANPPTVIRSGNVDALSGVSQENLTWTPVTSSPCSLGSVSFGGPGSRLQFNLSLEIPGFVSPGPPDFTLFETYFEGVTVQGETSGAQLILGGTFFCEVAGGQFRVYQPPLGAGDGCEWRPGTGPGDFYTQRLASGPLPAFQNGENLIFL